MTDDLESLYIKDKYLGERNDNAPEPISEDERREICTYIDYTHDADVVRALLHLYPDFCQWPEARYCAPIHCCILNLLVQAGLGYERATYSINKAVVWEDWRALASLANVERPLRGQLFGSFYWGRALRHTCEDTLNFMATHEDPSPFLHSCSYVINQKKISYENGVFTKPWNAEEEALDVGVVPQTVEEGRQAVDECDTPSMIRSLCRLCPEILHDLELTPRYRRPSILETLSALGCPGVTYEGHTCANL